MCFAYSTASMISQRVGFRVSPLDVATTFFLSSPLDLKKSTNQKIKKAIRQDVELMDKFLNDQRGIDISNDYKPDLEPYIDRLEGGEEDSAALMANLKNLCRESDLPAHDGFAAYSKEFTKLRAISKILRTNMTYRSVAGAPRHIRNAIADRFNAGWMSIVKERCKGIYNPVPLLPNSFRLAQDQENLTTKNSDAANMELERNEMMNRVNYAIDHGRYPVFGFSYYLLQPRASDDPDRFADHSSAIVGRKMRGEVCHYMVEDNSGEFCHRFRPTCLQTWTPPNTSRFRLGYDSLTLGSSEAGRCGVRQDSLISTTA